MSDTECKYFCLCDSYQTGNSQNIHLAKLTLTLFFILIVTMIGIKVGIKWFIFKDYFPLKQKSPILCILLGITICLQLIIYPLLYTVHYYTNSFAQHWIRVTVRTFFTALQNSVYIIYYVRCMRIIYAHETHISRNGSLIFKLFQKQLMLVWIIVAACFIKALPVLFTIWSQSNSGFQKQHFKMVIEYVQDEDNLIFHIIFQNFLWQLILIYCFWLQKNVNKRYSMKKQLILIILQEMILSVVQISLGFRDINNVLHNFCPEKFFYPLSQLILVIKMISLFVVSLILPLTQKKIYHRLLPTGRHYGFVKTMRDFLMQQQFLRVFTHFLKHLDKKEGNSNNQTILQFWKQLMVLRIRPVHTEQDKLTDIQELISQVQDKIFPEHKLLISDLKQSIYGLQNESIISSEVLKQRCRSSINQKVESLQKIALERLDKIYVNQYRLTESYYNMKQITNQNKKINLNMIMLNMALIVDSENEFV